jgi:taurine dioxygenase
LHEDRAVAQFDHTQRLQPHQLLCTRWREPLGLSAVHSWEASAFREALGERGDDALIAAIKAFKPVTHKVVRVNPDSGRKCLFVNSDFTRHIIGIDRHEAVGILRFLLEWMKKPESMVHHQWEPHGIAIWDNRSTQHYAVADYWPHHRVNQRVTFDGPGSTTQDGVNVNERVLKSQGLQ